MELISILVYVVLFTLVVWGGFWIIGRMALTPDPNRFALIVWGVLCLIVLISAMTGYLSMPSLNLRR